MLALKDSAAFGRQSSYEYGEAIRSATEGLKNENSVLVDNAGVTKNVAKMWEEYAKAQGKTVAELTQEEKILAEVNGILEESKYQAGDAAKYASTFSGRVAQLNALFIQLKNVVGQVIMPIANLFIPIIQRAMNALISFFSIVKQVMAALGFDMSSGINNSSSAFSTLGTTATDAGSSIESTSKKAKKAKSIMNYDELNILKSNDDSSTKSPKNKDQGSPTTNVPGLDIPQISSEDTISPKAQKIADNIKNALGVIQSAFAKCQKFVSKNWKTIVTVVASGAVTIGTAIAGIKIASFITTISKAGGVAAVAKTAFAGLSAVLGAVSAPVLAVIAAVALLAGSMTALYLNSESFRNSINQIVGIFVNSLQGIFNLFVTTIIPSLIDGFNSFITIMTPLADFITTVFIDAWQNILQPALEYIGGTVIPKLTSTFEKLWNKILVPLGTFIGSVLEPVVKILTEALSILWTNVGIPLADFLGGVFSSTFEGVTDLINDRVIPIVERVITVAQFLWTNVLAPIVDFLWKNLKPAFENVCTRIGKIFGGLKDIFSGVIDFVTGIFTLNWEKAWEGVKSIFSGIWETLGAVIASPINLILAGVESMINALIEGFNLLKKAINKISFDVPDWVPVIGGQKWGFNLKMSKPIELPRLAEGGWVEPNKPRPVIVGDNKREGEIIAPESKIYEQSYKASVAANTNKQNVQKIEITLIHKYPDGRYMIQEINNTQIIDGKITLLT